MAKMFYTLEEAAEKLGVNEDRIKEMASEGQIQQFRDRDKLMFKRDQVDSMANTTDLDEGGEASEASGGPLSLADSTADTFELADSGADAPSPAEDSGVEGMSVFEEDEVKEADPLAGTQVTGSDLDDDLQLEQVGSSAGSGLLDLTNESDDTSLGAELLDEIYPGGGSPGDTSVQTTTDSGIFGASSSGSAPAIGGDTGTFTDLGEVSAVEAGTPIETLAPVSSGGSTTGDKFLGGSLLGVVVALIVMMLVILPAWSGSASVVTDSMASSPMYYGIWVGGLVVVWLICGVLGLVLGGRD
ncbi:helix-turn-helix domain-containing protein [Mucisphaera calidilacus]|uniref:Helix-turn-helix domain protein n=1 Tax=Mucisphaera calidilacus TaxID=2527982 RepID=A0A518BXI7_9BACT|nr:helix-turn-helix domain-containing protein [Mucisphaera calidilacus]QDU71691.1 Helix-turn-helix domain protein [Mucisphaera calidilacus]